MLLSNGSITSPSLSFVSNQTTGFYLRKVGDLSVTVNGSAIASFQDNSITTNVPLRITSGVAARPSISFGADQDTGFFRPSNGTIAFSANGQTAITLSSNGLILPSSVTSGRPQSPSNGLIRTNSQTNSLDLYINDAWVSIGAGSSGASQSWISLFNTDFSQNPVDFISVTVDSTVYDSIAVHSAYLRINSNFFDTSEASELDGLLFNIYNSSNSLIGHTMVSTYSIAKNQGISENISAESQINFYVTQNSYFYNYTRIVESFSDDSFDSSGYDNDEESGQLDTPLTGSTYTIKLSVSTEDGTNGTLNSGTMQVFGHKRGTP